MVHRFIPAGVCSTLYEVELENGVIKRLEIHNGCDGNAKGLSKLVQGMDAQEAAGRLAGIRCGSKSTSCPDQIAAAIREALEREAHTES